MSLSPSEEMVVCATASQQLLLHILSSTDLTKVLDTYIVQVYTCTLDRLLRHLVLHCIVEIQALPAELAR